MNRVQGVLVVYQQVTHMNMNMDNKLRTSFLNPPTNRVQDVLGVVYEQVTHMNMNMEKIIWYIQVKSQRIKTKIRNDVAP